MSPVELRRRADAQSWLAAGLCLMRLSPPSDLVYLGVAPWLGQALSDTGALPPAGVIADIGHLLTGGSMRSLAPLPILSASLEQAVHAYEDHVLGRLDADPRLDAIIDALGRAPPDLRDRGVALFAGHLCRRLGLAGAAVAIPPGVIRSVTERPFDEISADGQAALAAQGDVEHAIEAGYRDLIAGARRLGTLVSDAELFLMENLDALGQMTQRVAIEQVIDVAGALTAAMPKRLKPSASVEHARVPTTLTAADTYPTGGFSALSTSGTIENLVTSELIYMDEGEPDSIDLFDVRYAEGELLYYTRDESVFVRGRRVIGFVFMPDLTTARFKDPELSWQRLIVLLGFVTCAVHRLSEWLAGDGLTFQLLFVTDGDGSAEASPLGPERSLCELSLREFIAKDMVRVGQIPSAAAAMDLAGRWTADARSDVIVASAARLSLRPPPGVLLGTLYLGEAEPDVTWGTARPSKPAEQPDGADAPPADLWSTWVAVALDILQALL